MSETEDKLRELVPFGTAPKFWKEWFPKYAETHPEFWKDWKIVAWDFAEALTALELTEQRERGGTCGFDFKNPGFHPDLCGLAKGHSGPHLDETHLRFRRDLANDPERFDKYLEAYASSRLAAPWEKEAQLKEVIADNVALRARLAEVSAEVERLTSGSDEELEHKVQAVLLKHFADKGACCSIDALAEYVMEPVTAALARLKGERDAL